MRCTKAILFLALTQLTVSAERAEPWNDCTLMRSSILLQELLLFGLLGGATRAHRRRLAAVFSGATESVPPSTPDVAL
jgi:hypothetical protein